MNEHALERQVQAALSAERRAHGAGEGAVEHEPARIFRMNGTVEQIHGRAGKTRMTGQRRG